MIHIRWSAGTKSRKIKRKSSLTTLTSMIWWTSLNPTRQSQTSDTSTTWPSSQLNLLLGVPISLYLVLWVSPLLPKTTMLKKRIWLRWPQQNEMNGSTTDTSSTQRWSTCMTGLTRITCLSITPTVSERLSKILSSLSRALLHQCLCLQKEQVSVK